MKPDDDAAADLRLPDFLQPQLCTLVERPPAGADWVHEVKFDGYRMQLRVRDGQATLRTRNGLDWSAKFAAIRRDAATLPDAIIDGEVVALDAAGAPDFVALQAALADQRTDDLSFFAFDLLHDGGGDLRGRALRDRKARLKQLLDAVKSPRLHYVEHFASGGDAVLLSACRLSLEGVVSKKIDAPYVAGRSETWAKSKCRAGHEVVIGGWTTSGGRLRSLLAGVCHAGRLVPIGRVGSGFGRDVSAWLQPRLDAVGAKASPFARRPATGAGQVHWARPELVAEIEFAGWTGAGMVRQASFKGLRQDKAAGEVETETPVPEAARTPQPKTRASQPAAGRRGAVVMGVVISHPDKPMWPDAGGGAAVSKLELARYLEAAAPWMMPHLQGRPCSILRAPDGFAGKHFFQRHTMSGSSNLLERIEVDGDHKSYLQIDRPAGLAVVAQTGGLELHPCNCAPAAPDVPGRLVFDLAPGPGVPFDVVAMAARDLRDRLEELGLAAFCKTTGGKGLHVVTPLAKPAGNGSDWTQAKAFARTVCRRMERDAPARYVTKMAKAARNGRIFLDYLRNDRLATAVAPLSPRARAGATVSMPLAWSQVQDGLDPSRYTVRTAMAALAQAKPWEDYDQSARPLANAIKRLGS